MGRAVGAFLVFVGGNAFAVWLGNMRMPQYVWLLVTAVSFAGAGLILWWPRWKAAWAAFLRPANAAPIKPSSSRMLIDIDSKDYRRYVLATYYLHALQYREMANASDAISRAKLEDIRNRLNRMREELRGASALLSEATSLEFNEPYYQETMLQQQVIENADHFMAKAYQKWKAWGGNSAAAPLAAIKS